MSRLGEYCYSPWMDGGIEPQAVRPAAAGALTARILACGPGWSVADIVCRAGPADRPFEERHRDVSIAAVVEGSFQYRSARGTALLYPGAFLLGDADTCFECGHDHGTGDRCVAFHFAPELFEEIAATAAGSPRFRFPAAMLPAGRNLAPPVARAAAAAERAGKGATEELAIGVAEAVLATLSGHEAATPAPSARDHRRVSDALRHMEAHADGPVGLDELAAVARMSKYHFLRVFRRVTGVTPYQVLISLRLRRAAVRLRTSRDAVAAIAFDAGFGDLSTFNARFRSVFGASPGAFRRERDAGVPRRPC